MSLIITPVLFLLQVNMSAVKRPIMRHTVVVFTEKLWNIPKDNTEQILF